MTCVAIAVVLGVGHCIDVVVVLVDDVRMLLLGLLVCLCYF